MNIYYLRIITGVSTMLDVEVRANGLAWSDSGLYEFWAFNESGNKIGVAYYPIDTTIIESIEYNIDENK